jgi:hypothetical protein
VVIVTQKVLRDFGSSNEELPQALVSFKKYMPPPLPYFKVNICPLPLPQKKLEFDWDAL